MSPMGWNYLSSMMYLMMAVSTPNMMKQSQSSPTNNTNTINKKSWSW